MTTVEIYYRTGDDMEDIAHVTYENVMGIKMLPGEAICPDLIPDVVYLRLILNFEETATYDIDGIVKMSVYQKGRKEYV